MDGINIKDTTKIKKHFKYSEAYRKRKREWLKNSPKQREKSRAATKLWVSKNKERMLDKAKKYSKKYYALNTLVCKQRHRKRHLMARFGITDIDYDLMLESQNGVCAICKVDRQMKRRMSVDHDHVTGKIRKLLCGSCNMKLGWYEKYKDSVNFYIASHEK